MTRTVTAKHAPMRRCVLCRASMPQAQLIRLVQSGDAVRLDLTRKLGGRGTWVCRDCAVKANDKRLRAAFKGQAPQVAQLLSQQVTGVENNQNGGMNV